MRFSQLVVGDGLNANMGSNSNANNANKSTLSKSTNNKSLMSTVNRPDHDNNRQLLTLRKLIDLRFSHKSINSNNNSINSMNDEKLLRLKLAIIMKLL